MTDSEPAPDIAMWGASGSGKTAFLAALSIALNRAGTSWRLVGENQASGAELIRLRNRLLDDRMFPDSTESLTYYNWLLIGAAESRRQWWRPWRTLPGRAPRIRLDFLDPRGGLYAEEQASVDKETLVASLVRSRGLIYMFDPDRESRVGDAFKHLDQALNEVAGQMLVGEEFADGKLPHYIAVCITKYDDPRVLMLADRWKLAEPDVSDDLRIPRVDEDRAREFFHRLCRHGRSHNAEMIVDLIETYFHKDRVRFFVTSSVGMYIDERRRRFDPDDFLNVIDDPHKGLMIRGAVRPINVMEPVIWLGDMLSSRSMRSG
ncbi:hypothetical protein AB0K18_15465 [Nonomuraea sp. NPDC049421]|uniref:hypothetical protein n=1 Tax=Nonomuraea sp. NPDC049421 TaxID=3155275 RepID=UPI00342E6D97